MECLSDRALRRFAAGSLSEPRQRDTAEHLEQCEDCARRVEKLFLGDEPTHPFRVAPYRVETGDAATGETDPALADLRLRLYELAGPPADHEQVGDGHAKRASSRPHQRDDSPQPPRLSRFKIDRRLGSGGFGDVFLAYDELLKRNVAIKLPRTASLADHDLMERFLREGKAAAQLHHPNIIPVYEAGTIDSVCYLASAYCDGPTLRRWLNERAAPAEPRFAAWLVAALADAVEHAHRRGILHRDVKPGNVLLEPAPNEPFGCTPKLTDFGLAKIIERDSTDQDTTASHLLMGTPRYMSPEQAAGRRDEIGTATDIYSLGVVLYELLTGVPPVVGGNHAETLQRLLLEEPVRPRQRTPGIPRDLEAICLKCLEKRPERRFGHASQLAEDLRRFLRGDTTHARPLSRTEAMRRWAVRHPVRATIVSASLLVWLVLLGSLVGYTRLLQQSGRRIERSLQEARAARMQAMTSEARLREMLYVADMKLAKRALDDGDLRQLTRLLEAHKKRDDQSDLRDFSWRFLRNSSNQRQRLLATCPGDVYHIRFSRNGDRLAAACKDGIARIYECEGWSPVAEIETGQGELNGVSFSPDTSRLATAGDDGTAVVWRVEDGQRLLTIPALPRLAFQALFSPDGKTIVTCGESPVIGLWDSETGESLGSLLGHEKPVESIAISPDGRWLASASSDRTTKLWNLAERKLERNLSQHENRVTTIAFSGDGQRLAAGTVEGNAIVWDVESRKRLLDVQHLDGVQSVTFSPNGQSLLVSDRSGVARLWPIDSQLAPLTQPDTVAWQAHEGRTWSAAYSADGEFAVTSGADGSIRLWRLSGAPVRVIRGSFANPFVDISIADEQLVTLRKNTGLRTRSLPGCETIQLVENHGGAWMTTCRLTPHHFLIGTEDGRLLLWDMEANEVVTEWTTEFKSQIEAIRLSREGRLLAVHFYDEDTVTLFEIKHTNPPELVRTHEVVANIQHVALSSSGRWLAVTDGDDISVWYTATGKCVATLTGHTSTVMTLAFSEDEQLLVSGSRDRQVKVWEWKNARSVHSLEGHRDDVQSVAVSVDGRTIASGDRGGRIKLWHARLGSELLEISTGSQPVSYLLFSDDGHWLASIDGHASLRLIDGRPLDENAP